MEEYVAWRNDLINATLVLHTFGLGDVDIFTIYK